MNKIRPNEQRAKNAITLIYIILSLEIISFISGFLQFGLLQTIAQGGEISDKAAEANDSREQIIGFIYLAAYIVSAVMFIQWFRRAYFNLHQKVNFLSHSEGWAAGAWFVPFICLYRPYQIMKELFQETDNLLVKNGLNITGNFAGSTLVWWWALWIINNFVGQLVFRLSKGAETLEELTTMTVVSMAAHLIGIPLALVTVKLIKDYSKVEPFLHEINQEQEIIRAMEVEA
jgi:hypothetical protein